MSVAGPGSAGPGSAGPGPAGRDRFAVDAPGTGLRLRAAVWRNGRAEPLGTFDAILARLRAPGGDPAWIEAEVGERIAAYGTLAGRFGFHPLLVEDALDEGDRPLLKLQGGWMFLTVPCIQPAGAGEDEDRYREVGLFLAGETLVSVVTAPDPALTTMFDAAVDDVPPDPPHAAMLVYRILDAAADAYYPATGAVEDDVDLMEDRVLAGGRFAIAETLAVKRRLLELRRRVGGMRDIVNELMRQPPSRVPPAVHTFLQDVYDHSLRLLERVDLNRDLLGTVVDAHLNLTSNTLNQTMRTLTVASIGLMTGALVAGIYGMNFEFMPELRQPWGYPAAIGLMLALAAAQVAYFRRRGWF